MTNNDVLRRLRYIFDLNEHKMVSIFALADTKVTQAQITSWLKKDEDPDYENCSDTMLASFLNGLISEKRGKKEGAQPRAETRINNNMIFMKLKIALNLKSDDVLAIMGLSGLQISEHELSAFFRRPDHKHFRKCKDQVLRNFLMGLQIKYRGALETKPPTKSTTKPTIKPAPGSLYRSK